MNKQLLLFGHTKKMFLSVLTKGMIITKAMNMVQQ